MSPNHTQGLEKKYRMTLQRRVILDEMRKTKIHPTADEIYDVVRKILPRISLGTVYRNLEILSEFGLIQKIGPIASQMRYDCNTENHYHLRCVRCGKVVDAPMAPLEDLDRLSCEMRDFAILGHRLEFYGICPDCGELEESVS
jgi:Fur family ferric uptake transcriptional regulator